MFICSRVLIAQDRHEVYVICATYDADYVRYVKNRRARRGGADTFLVMHEFGPYRINRHTHARQLCIILLAIMMKWGGGYRRRWQGRASACRDKGRRCRRYSMANQTHIKPAQSDTWKRISKEECYFFEIILPRAL